MKHTLFILLTMALCVEATAVEAPDTCPAKPIDKDSAVALASTWFEKGRKLVEVKEYDEAVDAFACSLRMVEHQATLFNASRAAILAEKFDVAIEMADIIIEFSPDDQAKQEARELLAAAEHAKQENERETEFDPGPVVEPEMSVPTVSPVTIVNDTGTKEEPVSAKGRSSAWRAGVILSVVGGAGVIAGGLLQGLAGSAQQTTGETSDYEEYADAKADVDTFQTGAIVSFVAGGVFVGAGIVLFLIDGKKNEEQSVSFVPSGNGFLWGGTF